MFLENHVPMKGLICAAFAKQEGRRDEQIRGCQVSGVRLPEVFDRSRRKDLPCPPILLPQMRIAHAAFPPGKSPLFFRAPPGKGLARLTPAPLSATPRRSKYGKKPRNSF